jgi:O-antigen ligase
MVRFVSVGHSIPVGRTVEYLYFALLINSIMGSAWGISVPFVGGAGLALLAVYCLWQLRNDAKTLCAQLLLPAGCAAVFVAIQVLVYDGSVLDQANREFINWIWTIIIVQSLVPRGKFLHHFALLALGVGALLLPYLDLTYGGEGSIRAGLERDVGFANPNDLAAWFGFCCVYAVVVAVETRRNFNRIIWLFVAAGSLTVVGLTVSRATLMAVAITGIIASRRLLKRGFVPLLLFAILGSAFFVSGLFDEAVGHYEKRGTEESGRLLVWPLAIERFLESPLAGVGVGKLGTYVPEMGTEITPHNGFLYIALGAGILPLALFVGYWCQATKGTWQSRKRGLPNASFQIPLLVYAFIVSSFGASAFMFPWAVVSLCQAVTRNKARGIVRIVRRSEAVRQDSIHGLLEENASHSLGAPR